MVLNNLVRTMEYALEIQKQEGGDAEVIAVASLVHDIHRIMGETEKRFVSPKESLPKIREVIANLPITDKQKAHICYIVEHHEEHVIGKPNPIKDIETLIVQDADCLDTLGAVAIARTVQYGVENNIPLYRPDIPFYQDEKLKCENDVSTMHFIYNKLLRLGENMNTQTAREIAKPKTKLMQDFLNMFVEEWKEPEFIKPKEIGQRSL